MFGAFWNDLRRALWTAIGHNVFGNAKASAYSQLLSLFPALLVGTTLLTRSSATDSVRGDVHSLLVDVLPPQTMYLVQNYFTVSPGRSLRLLLTAGVIALAAATGVMLSLMDGFRRAYRLPRHTFGFWKERLIALLLIPCTLVPMLCATAFVIFGHEIELWMMANADHILQLYVILAWRLLRWVVAMATSVAVLVVIYHFGVSTRPQWSRVLPGALLATVTWFSITLVYGWYVTRFANYSIVYGSLGAGVATMVWLYMVSLTTLIGAEYNAQLYPLLELLPEVQDADTLEGHASNQLSPQSPRPA